MRVRVSLLVSVLGTAVLFALGRLLHGLVGSAWDLSFCAMGAFASTLLVHRFTGLRFSGNLGASTIIVFVTFVSISIGHGASQVFDRHVAIDFEPIGKFLWATIATSWWLIPLCAVVITQLNRAQARRTG